MPQRSMTASKIKTSDRHVSACQPAAADSKQDSSSVPYRCVFLTEAQSSSVGMLSRKRRDLMDDQRALQMSPDSCSSPGRVYAGMSSSWSLLLSSIVIHHYSSRENNLTNATVHCFKRRTCFVIPSVKLERFQTF